MAPMSAKTPGVDRRIFLGMSATAFGGSCLPGVYSPWSQFLKLPALLFDISLAEWSLHRALNNKELDHLDFPKKAKSFGIGACEYVNTFWKDKARDAKYVAELGKRCEGEGVKSVLIMCDGEGALGDPDDQKRTTAVENHYKWVEAAAALGCHSIRVNAQSSGSYEEQQKLAADGLHRLAEYGDKHAIHVIVENHGGLSSNGKWLSETLTLAGHPQCGSLPDFGNFRISDKEEYDRYLGTDQLMPFARGVSAKTHDFDEQGNETHTDYFRMLEIVVGKHAWHGHIGIEYEGNKLSEDDGIRATKKLLERVRDAMQAKLDEQAKAAGKDGK